MNRRLISMAILCSLVFTGFAGLTEFASKEAHGITYVSGIILPPGDTWTPGGSPYIVTGDINVLTGAVLTIAPGTNVMFDGYYSIKVDGAIIAIGTPTERILISSFAIPPIPGSWDRIEIEPGGHAEFQYCDISFGDYGIFLKSSNNIISNTTLSHNKDGINLDSATGNTITNNNMNRNGIVILGDLLGHWNSHNIDETNIVNGKPLYYWKNQTGGTVPAGAGQVILANCTNVMIENQELVDGSVGIELGFSSSNYILGNNLSLNHRYSIYLSHSDGNTIADNTASYNDRDGVSLHYSDDNTIASNTASYNDRDGVSLDYSDGNTIASNTASYNDRDGVSFDYSDGNAIADNAISSNYYHGIYLNRSMSNNLTGNIMVKDGIVVYGELIEYWDTNSADLSNTINGKYVYYLKNTTGGITPSNAGQVILVNSTNIIIENQNLSFGSVAIELAFSSNNYVRNNYAFFNDWYGIYIYNSDWNSILENNVSHNYNQGIFIYQSDNNTVSMNTAFNNNFDCVGDDDGFYMYGSNQNIISYNTIFFIIRFGFEIHNSNINNIDGNIIFSDYDERNDVGIDLSWSHGNNLRYNVISMIHDFGIGIDNSDFNYVSGNNISNDADGIRLGGSNWNNITRNFMTHFTSRGIHIMSSDNTIMDNIISNAFYAAIDWGASHSHRNIIKYNYISNSGIGIQVFDSSWTEITGNTVINNNYGIIIGEFPLDVCEYTDIENNTIIDNNNGLLLNDVKNNKIHHNNFINNMNQSYDDWNNVNKTGNYWDNGYVEPLNLTISGGNYWSDYTGPDDFRGPGQNVSGSDAVGDVPYDIPGGTSKDHYPLLTPVVLPPRLPPPPLPPQLYVYAMPNRKDIMLNWDFPSSPGVDHFLIYRAPNQTGFDFDSPWINTSSNINPMTGTINNLSTMWIDANVIYINHPDYRNEYYYTVRTVNTAGERSATSNTAGYYRMDFDAGLNTFSLPLEPFAPQSLSTLMAQMSASSISWLDAGDSWWTYPSIPSAPAAQLGEGYVVEFSNPSSYVFTGEPAAMILYDEGFGFDPASRDDIDASVDPSGNVTVSWTQIPGADGYHMLRSTDRDGFHSGNFESFDAGTSPFIDFSATGMYNELYYMIVPYNLTEGNGSSTYSIGVISEEYNGNEMFSLPLKPTWGDMSADWYADAIDNCLGIVYLENGNWKPHFKEFPEGVYDASVVLGRGYELTVVATARFTQIGW